MTLTFRPAPAETAQLLDFPGTSTKEAAFVVKQLENLQSALALHHGDRKARMLLAGAATTVVARSARAAGCEVATRYAMEVSLEQEFGGEFRL